MTLRETVQMLSEYQRLNHDKKFEREIDRIDALENGLLKRFGWWAIPQNFFDYPEYYLEKGVMEQEVEEACDDPLDYFESMFETTIDPKGKGWAECERKLRSLTPAQQKACADGLRYYIQRDRALVKNIGFGS